MSCTPELSKTELRLGLATSVVTGMVNAGLQVSASHAGLDPRVAVPVTLFSLGLVGHALDILLAKRCFPVWSGSGEVEVLGLGPRDFGRRAAWYGRSLLSMSFARYLLLSLLDTLVVSRLSQVATRKLDEYGLLVGQRVYRDPLVVLMIGLITFNLYVNVLRFAWVYESSPNLSLTVILSLWMVYMLVDSYGK